MTGESTVGHAGPDVVRLRNIILAGAVLALAAGLFTVVMSLTVARIAWLFVIGLFVVSISFVLALATLPLRQRRVFAAVMIFAVANWIVAIVSAAVATFAWPLLMVSSLLPSLVAASFVTADRLWWFVIPSFSIGTIAVGPTAAAGVTGVDAADGADVPARLVAVTRNV
ncbi:MAG: hypothetical protein R2697_03495 [Ilumatobacteraceae bacterium]